MTSAETTTITVAGYRVTTFPELGNGQFGRVYNAVHAATRTAAAAKHIQFADVDVGRQTYMRQMASQELRVIRSVHDHANIVRLLDYELATTSCWLFMELCDLQHLATYLKRNATLDLNRKVTAMSEVASAVDFMHRHLPPIVHRDIKLENILVKTEGREHVMKISDFGLSKLYEDKPNVSFTQAKLMETACGSYYFMAPEFFAEAESGLKYSATVDVFACALVFAIVLAYCPSQTELVPMSVQALASGKAISIGSEMILCHTAGTPLPVPVTRSRDDDHVTGAVKQVILDMTQFSSECRCTMREAARALDQLRAPHRGSSETSRAMSNLDLEDRSHVMVAAIDFGTTYSGYAFSFTSEPEQIFMNKNWGGNAGFASYKAPTSVLVTSDGQFMAFGFEAEHMYAESLACGDRTDYKLFRHFKMILHNTQTLSRSTTIEAVNGQTEPALNVFAHALSYLKNHMIKAVRSARASSPDAGEIRWVITVPAIWSEESKNFMREAACKAGLIGQKHSRKLLIALEPEAASLCCRRLEIAGYDEGVNLAMAAGTKYLVIDCGGGTVDITAHEVLSDGCIRELHSATGGAWGGTRVDHHFVALLRQVLSDKFIDEYQRACAHHWLNFMTSFQCLKKSVSRHGSKSLNIAVDLNMAKKYQEIMGRGNKIQDAITQKSHLGVSFSNGNLILHSDTAKSLFEPVLQTLLDHIANLLNIPEIQPCGLFFLVGGFGESAILQKTLMERFAERVRILIPASAQMAIIKGAVLFGHRPKEIKSRIARLTYGTSGINPADESRDLFSTFVRKGEQIEDGETRTFVYLTENAHQTHADIPLYSMNRPPKPVDYVDGNDVTRLGKFTVATPGERRDRVIEVDVTFGNTELQIEARASGEPATASIDFMAS